MKTDSDTENRLMVARVEGGWRAGENSKGIENYRLVTGI